ncbi:MAG: MmcQ/YjbR family DNA-binding protein [Bacillota bacterium]
MDYQTLKNYLLSKKGAREDYPFGEDVPVFKVGSKMFALINDDEGKISMNLKCDPQRALVLRSYFPAVKPGYHMNKTHWNTVEIDGSIPDDEIMEMIEHSYELVFKSLTKVEKAAIL